MRNKTLTCGVIAAAVLASTSVAQAQVRVGSVGGVTGPLAALIQDIVAGRNLAAAQITRKEACSLPGNLCG